MFNRFLDFAFGYARNDNGCFRDVLDVGEVIDYYCVFGKLKSQIKPTGLETDDMIEITDDIFICEDELIFKASRSGGPGGQNVNKVNTRITLLFDVANCESFSDAQKQRILSRLSTRADKNGLIRVISQKFRTQKANRRAAVERLQQLLAEALKIRLAREKTKIPYVVKQRRLEEKRRRSLLKQQRAKRSLAEDFWD
ncbi:MAG: alternative ribosome rescue aminoacyl-tRNA hydrolase ArfB [Sedimentisphaerales bacterium]